VTVKCYYVTGRFRELLVAREACHHKLFVYLKIALSELEWGSVLTLCVL